MAARGARVHPYRIVGVGVDAADGDDRKDAIGDDAAAAAASGAASRVQESKG